MKGSWDKRQRSTSYTIVESDIGRGTSLKYVQVECCSEIAVNSETEGKADAIPVKSMARLAVHL